MRRNQFKLEPLLKYRKLIEDGKKQALADLNDSFMREEEKFQALKQKGLQCQQALYSKISEGITSEDAQPHFQYLNLLESEGLISQLKLLSLEAAIEDARQQLVEVAKQRRIIEKLKEKMEKKKEEEMRKREQNFLDEIWILRRKAM